MNCNKRVQRKNHYQESKIQELLEQRFPGIFQMSEDQFKDLKTYYKYKHLIPIIDSAQAFTITEIQRVIREDYGYAHSFTTISHFIRLLYKDGYLKAEAIDSGLPKKAQVYWVPTREGENKAEKLKTFLHDLKKYPKKGVDPQELEEKSYLLAKAQMKGFARARAEKIHAENPAVKIHEIAVKTTTTQIGKELGKEMALGLGAALPKRQRNEKPKARLQRVKEALDKLHGVFEDPSKIDALEEKNETDHVKTCKECGHKFLASESDEYCLVCYEKKTRALKEAKK